MKKRMIMFALLLMAMVSVQAQSLLGTWMTNYSEGEISLKWYMTFSTGQKTTIKIVQSLSVAEFGNLELTMTIPGTYILKGKTITLKMNGQGADAKITKMQLNSNLAKQYKEDPEMKKLIDDTFNESKVQMKNELKEPFSFSDDIEIVSQTNTTLKLEMGDDVMTFTKTK